MSWFDTAGLASFAKSALSSAQKHIDKALDIKEEDLPHNRPVTSPIIHETESFFEDFGVGSVSVSDTNSSKKQKLHHDKLSLSSDTVPQGFWTDTWSSFFEGNAAVPDTRLNSKTARPEPSSCNIPPKDSAVSSQPQRSSLFPSNVSPEEESTVVQDIQTSAAVPPHIELNTELEITELDLVETETSSIPQDIKETYDQESCSDAIPSTEQEDNVAQAEDTNGISSPEESKCADQEEDSSAKLNDSSNTMEYDIVDLSDKSLKLPSSESPSDSPTTDKSFYKVTEDMMDFGNSSESFVNLGSNSASSNAIAVESSELDSVRSNVEDEPSPNESNVDSFHILGESVVGGDWLVKDRNLVETLEEDQLVNVDSGSDSSKEERDVAIKECDVKSFSSGGSQEMANSYVKCSIEEAEGSLNRGHSPLSTTNSERSDCTKLESEQNTSGDENETTTSSDIEILSPPNGENLERNVSPLKHMWAPRTLRAHGSESPSFDGTKDNVMPVLEEGENAASGDSTEHTAELYYFKPDNTTGIPQTVRGIDILKVLQQQAELQALLEVREKRIVELSKENVQLHENEDNLKSQISEIKASANQESQNVSSMTKDFAQRFAQVESRMNEALKERDRFKIQLEEAQNQVFQRITIDEMEGTMKEKDQQIKELMEEGEKLSKKELQHTTIIKKLRAKEEEMEHTTKSLREKLEDSSKESERLRKSLGAKDEQEKKHIDAIRQLTATVSQQELELESLRSAIEDSTEKEISLKKSLESTYKDLTELRKTNASKDKEIQELSLSVEMSTKEKIREGLDQANKEATKEREILLIQLEDMRNGMKRSEDDYNHRESILKDDISRLQMRLQESDARSEELTKSMSIATRPLVRQIENLQTIHNTQISSWEKVEKNLTDRLSDTQSQLAVCSEREKLLNEKYRELNSKFKRLEIQANDMRQEKIQLSSEVEILSSKIVILEETKNRHTSSVDSLKSSFNLETNKLKEEKSDTERELKHCLELLKEERGKVQMLQDELRQKDLKFQTIENTSPSHSASGSFDGVHSWIQEQAQERRIVTPVNSHRVSVYDSLRSGCTTSILENLQSQLKQRDGEIVQLQCEITKLESERESMTQELVNLSNQKDDLEEKLEKLNLLEKQHRELEQKYNTLLQMYGEKVEENEELQLDLVDVKTMYKAQIEELVRRN